MILSKIRHARDPFPWPAQVDMKPAALFPAFLKIAGRPCLVVGGGPIAEEKVSGLILAGANVCVVAPTTTDQIRDWASQETLRWKARKFQSADMKGNFLVVAATSSERLHGRIYQLAKKFRVLCNVVDDPDHCDFYYGSVVRRGSLQIAISTAGLSPALAQRLRKRFELEFGVEYELWLEELGKARTRLFDKRIEPGRRKQLLHRLASELSFKEFLRRQNRTPIKG
jgi:precorrin-2 dehydrogenase / sirohydrochlorin ferrochelatase